MQSKSSLLANPVAANAISAVAACVMAIVAHVLGVALCPLKRTTGLPCPSCGTTRAILMALQGDFYGAFVMQPLVMALLLVAAPALLFAVCVAGRAKVEAALRAAMTSIAVKVAIAAVIAANWIYLIVNGN